MATQLSAKGGAQSRTRALRSIDLNVRPRYLAIIIGVLLVIVYAGTIISWLSYREREHSAVARYEDSLALLQAPAADIESLRAEVDAALAAVAGAEALVAPPAIDLASDEAIELIVLRAESAGLAVRGVERAPVGDVKIQDLDFERSALRLTLDGDPQQMAAFLAFLNATHPTLVPSLESMEITDGAARAVFVFTGFTQVSETPAATATEEAAQ
jgi:hypothetical protein